NYPLDGTSVVCHTRQSQQKGKRDRSHTTDIQDPHDVIDSNDDILHLVLNQRKKISSLQRQLWQTGNDNADLREQMDGMWNKIREMDKSNQRRDDKIRKHERKQYQANEDTRRSKDSMQSQLHDLRQEKIIDKLTIQNVEKDLENLSKSHRESCEKIDKRFHTIKINQTDVEKRLEDRIDGVRIKNKEEILKTQKQNEAQMEELLRIIHSLRMVSKENWEGKYFASSTTENNEDENIEEQLDNEELSLSKEILPVFGEDNNAKMMNEGDKQKTKKIPAFKSKHTIERQPFVCRKIP
ncbi:Hypothetical predicted protein, partial [Mytilus galloprovincialis]